MDIDAFPNSMEVSEIKDEFGDYTSHVSNATYSQSFVLDIEQINRVISKQTSSRDIEQTNHDRVGCLLSWDMGGSNHKTLSGVNQMRRSELKPTCNVNYKENIFPTKAEEDQACSNQIGNDLSSVNDILTICSLPQGLANHKPSWIIPLLDAEENKTPKSNYHQSSSSGNKEVPHFREKRHLPLTRSENTETREADMPDDNHQTIVIKTEQEMDYPECGFDQKHGFRIKVEPNSPDASDSETSINVGGNLDSECTSIEIAHSDKSAACLDINVIPSNAVMNGICKSRDAERLESRNNKKDIGDDITNSLNVEMNDLNKSEDTQVPKTKKTTVTPRVECKTCGKTFKRKRYLTLHQVIHSGLKPYKCSVCEKSFNTSSYLSCHMKIHTNNRPHKCHICQMTFAWKNVLQSHLKSHTEERPFECETCGNTYKRKTTLLEHIKKSHTSDTKKVKGHQLSRDVFTRKSLLDAHVKSHDNPDGKLVATSDNHNQVDQIKNKKLPTDYTELGFDQKHSFNIKVETNLPVAVENDSSGSSTEEMVVAKENRDQQTVEGSNTSGTDISTVGDAISETCSNQETNEKDGELTTTVKSNGTEDKPRVECKTCGKTFKRKRYLTLHQVIHSRLKPYKCTVCDKSFNTSSSLSCHMKTHSNNRPYKCHICQMAFKYENVLQSHLKSHTDERPFECETCGNTYKRKATLLEHIKGSHSNKQKSKCEICGKEYTKKYALDEHMVLHTGVGSHKCDVCGVEFRNSSILKSHQTVHTGEKLFKCDVCETSFRTKSTLLNHTRVHTEERDFPCDICEAKFKTPTGLYRHKLIHTGEQPYKCELCPQKFNQSCSLKRHYFQVHDLMNTFKCSQCPRYFTKKKTLDAHLVKEHSIKTRTKRYK